MDESSNNPKLKEAIFQTIAFFDMFDHPLSIFEIWQYMKFECDIADIRIILDSRHDLRAAPSVIDRIDEKNGLYFLAGRDKIHETRLRRYHFAERKFRRLLLVSKIFKFIPWIRMIAMGNMMGASNLRDRGDIDLFIITEKKRVWITRFFCVAVVKLLKLRPEPGNEKDKICLSFFISESALGLRGLMLADAAVTEVKPLRPKDGFGLGFAGRASASRCPDIYFIYWLLALVPVYDAGGVYKKFIHENNWVHFFAPNWRPVEVVGRWQAGRPLPAIYRDIVDMLVGGLEPSVKKWQIKIMPEALARPLNKDTRVVANDSVIKLHANDRREEYRERWSERLGQYRQI